MPENEKSALAARLAQMIPVPMSRPVDYPGISAAQRELLDRVEELRRSAVADTYAERLTLDELSELVSFFQSHVGQAFLQTWPIFGAKMRDAYQSLNAATKRNPRLTGLALAGGSSAPTNSSEFSEWLERVKQDIPK